MYHSPWPSRTTPTHTPILVGSRRLRIPYVEGHAPLASGRLLVGVVARYDRDFARLESRPRRDPAHPIGLARRPGEPHLFAFLRGAAPRHGHGPSRLLQEGVGWRDEG